MDFSVERIVPGLREWMAGDNIGCTTCRLGGEGIESTGVNPWAEDNLVGAGAGSVLIHNFVHMVCRIRFYSRI